MSIRSNLKNITYATRSMIGLLLLNREQVWKNVRKIQKTNHEFSLKLIRMSLLIFRNEKKLQILLAYSLLETRRIEDSRKICHTLINEGINDQFVDLIIGWTYIRSMQDGCLRYVTDARHHLEKVTGDRYRHRAERGLSVVHLLTGNHEMALHYAERAYDHYPTPKYRAWLKKMIRQRDTARDRGSTEDDLRDVEVEMHGPPT